VIRADGSLKLLPRLALVALLGGVTIYALADPITLVFQASYSLVGVLLAIRRPRNPVGWLLIGISLAFVGTTTRDVDVAAVQALRAEPRDVFLVWLGSWTGGLAWLLYGTLAMVFPSGRLPEGPRGRRIARGALWIGLLVVVASMVGTPVTTVYDAANPEGIEVPVSLSVVPPTPEVRAAGAIVLAILLGVILTGIGFMLLRYRKADNETRLQIRWVLAAIVFVLLAILTGLLLTFLTGGLGGLEWLPAVIAYPTIPGAVAVAILRYRLFEIDRIVNRALVYGSVTAILAGILAAATAFSQRVLVELAGGSSEFAIVAITLVVATLYTPLRKRVETVVDRYFKYEQRQFGAYREELTRFATLLDPDRAAMRLTSETLRETQARGVAVVGTHGHLVASAGAWPSAIEARVAVEPGGGPFAAVLVGPRVDGRGHSSATLDAVATIGALANTVAGGRVASAIPMSRTAPAVGNPASGDAGTVRLEARPEGADSG
jgi:hypothetical protein